VQVAWNVGKTCRRRWLMAAPVTPQPTIKTRFEAVSAAIRKSITVATRWRRKNTSRKVRTSNTHEHETETEITG
jgi:hypothetical protein